MSWARLQTISIQMVVSRFVKIIDAPQNGFHSAVSADGLEQDSTLSFTVFSLARASVHHSLMQCGSRPAFRGSSVHLRSRGRFLVEFRT
jgi:hypothetical protein